MKNTSNIILKTSAVFILALIIGLALAGNFDNSYDYNENNDEAAPRKPVIYLYPEKEMEVEVSLDYAGQITHIYPAFNYGNTWKVTAKPDGSLFDENTRRHYKYLFWEGIHNREWNFDSGFVVKGADIIPFLEEKLEILGLNYAEINDFITYWYPKLSENEYTLIHFDMEEYTNIAKLKITPSPDSIIRVFMLAQKIDVPIDIAPQELNTPTRTGFVAVEWGGAAR
ncbi:MAG: hypothetical protein GYA87_03225 [Christensenellaceae bacterium]|nr:hypothetical protein [Christensenellaceae bacterium]